MTMKHALAIEEDTEPSVAEVDPDADDPEASGLLDSIAQDASNRPEAETPAISRAASSPFLLESLYFRSFGERGLLERDEEIALAKQLDLGTRQIRQALQQAVKVNLGCRRHAGVGSFDRR